MGVNSAICTGSNRQLRVATTRAACNYGIRNTTYTHANLLIQEIGNGQSNQ